MDFSVPTRRWLMATVVIHFIVSLVHGVAHDGAQVPLSRAATLFVYAVILAGPLVGLALMPVTRVGVWLIATSMAGAFVFGFVNHFVLATPDLVTRVTQPWRPLFATTAVLLAVTEAFGSGLATHCAWERKKAL